MKGEVVDVGVDAIVGSRVSAENICTGLEFLLCHCKTVNSKLNNSQIFKHFPS